VLQQVTRFLSVGAIAMVVDLSIFNLLVYFGVGILPANVISISAAALLGYYGNLKTTFGSRNLQARSSSFGFFSLVAVTSVAISHFLLLALINLFPGRSVLEVNVYKVAIIALTSVLRFIIYRYLIFV
jgi:putative flippase GtrA